LGLWVGFCLVWFWGGGGFVRYGLWGVGGGLGGVGFEMCGSVKVWVL